MNKFLQIPALESFFSPNIKKLYEPPKDSNWSKGANFSELSAGIISELNKQILSEISPFRSIVESRGSVKWYGECVRIIQSFLPDFWNYILFLGPIAVKWPCIKWVGHEFQFQNIIDNISSQSDAGDHYIAILTATSLAERILGNIFLMDGKIIPFLLRDILDSGELKLLLGFTLVDFLKVLIGSVNGLNFRNIAWHGFLSPKDVKDEYAAVILFALHLCGNKLSLCNRKIVARQYLNINKAYTVFSVYLPSNAPVTAGDLMALIKQLHPPFLLLDDFNSRHLLWGDTICNARGNLIERILMQLPISLINTGQVSQPLENVWEDVEINYEDVLAIFESSSLMPSVMKQFWIKALKLLLYRKADALIILLPLLENSLRILFAAIGNCPTKVLTATNSEFYITLDEILSPWQRVSHSKSTSAGNEELLACPPSDQTFLEGYELPNEQIHCESKKSSKIDQNDLVKCNKVPQVLGKQLTEALYDLFMLPSGPRIRDRISHGEVLPDSLPFSFIVYLFKLSLLVLSVDKWRFIDEFAEIDLFTIKCQCESINKGKFCSHHYIVEMDDCLKDNFLERSTTKIENSLISRLVTNLSSYKSIYHPLSDLRSNFLSILECLSTWKEWDFPKCKNFFHCNWEVYKTKYSSLVINLGSCLNIPACTSSTFCYKSSYGLIYIIQTCPQAVLFSADSELEILRILQRITNNILICVRNIRCSLKTKLELFLVKSLRSRQRDNYKKQLEIIPNIVDNINFILNILVMIYVNKNRIVLISKLQLNSLVKILKKILKVFENLVSYTEVSINKYQESLSLLEENTTYLVAHFV